MNPQTIEKLLEIKKLYDADILTKEEMEAEKRKLLHSTDIHDHETTQRSSSLKAGEVVIRSKWFWLSGVGVLAIIAILFAVSNFERKETEYYDKPQTSFEPVSNEPAGQTVVKESIIEDADNEISWSGDYVIEGEMYRMTTTNALLHLVYLSDGSYTGSIQVTAGDEDDDWYFGTILGDVDGTPSGSELSLTISRIRYANALSGDNIFDSEDYEKVTNGDVIFTLYTDGAYYKAKAIGAMKDYFDNITEPTTITKL